MIDSTEIRMIMLKIRNLIADKDMVTATANMDIARGGEWRMDYSAWHLQLSVEIEALFKQIEEQTP